MTGEVEPAAIIRRATFDDVPRVLELIAPFVDDRKLVPRTPEDVHRLIPNGFVAEAGDRIVGFSSVEIYSRKLAEIQSLAVAVDYQGQGLARRLLHCCVQRARENNVHELMAITSSEALFREFGFDYSLPDQKRALFMHPLTDPYQPPVDQL